MKRMTNPHDKIKYPISNSKSIGEKNEEEQPIEGEETHYCPKCYYHYYKWIEMIKTRFGWWTCPQCTHRCYGGFKI